MKRILSLIIALVVLSLSSIIAITAMLNSQNDNVVITENIIFGDRRYADGIKIKMLSTYQNHMYFDTLYTVGAPHACKTDFKYYQSKHYIEESPNYDSVTVSTNISYGIEVNTPIEELSGLDLAYRELYDETPIGEERQKLVYLQDYYKYYPISVYIDLPGSRYYNIDPRSAVYNGAPYEETIAIYNKFNEFFKVPVPTDLKGFYIGITKNSNTSIGISAYAADDYYFNSQSARTDTTCFFSIENKIYLENGFKYIDTSLIPGGYGLYAVNYKIDNYEAKINPDSLSMVYPLSKETTVKDLVVSADQRSLYLITEEENKVYLSIIDIETMTDINKICICEQLEEFNTLVFDDFIMFDGPIHLSVVKISEDRNHELLYTVKKNSEITNTWYYSDTGYTTADLNGERLAVITKIINDSGSATCGVALSIYDSTGLLYNAEYESSLAGGYNRSNYNKNCRPLDFNVSF